MEMVFVIDKTKCTGCKACVVTCKDKCGLDAGVNFMNVDTEEEGTFPKVSVTFSAHSCHNCENCACIKNCPKGAMNRKNDYSVVTVNQKKCIGCGICVKACPYGAPVLNTETKKSMKCNFCIDLLKKGEKPACVSVCNARALDFGELSEMQEKYPNAKVVKGKTNPTTLVIS